MNIYRTIRKLAEQHNMIVVKQKSRWYFGDGTKDISNPDGLDDRGAAEFLADRLLPDLTADEIVKSIDNLGGGIFMKSDCDDESITEQILSEIMAAQTEGTP